jgi:hypothetical protein
MGYSIAALASEREVARHDSQHHKQPQAACVFSSRKDRSCNGPGEGRTRLQWLRRGDPEVPANLALLSVVGTRLAIAPVSVQGVIARGFVDASLVGSGIGDADTGIVGVCLCWWNAKGCQCYGCCRRHAHYCPLHQFFLFLTPNGRVVVATDTVSHFQAETDSAERKPPGQHSREATVAASPASPTN